MRIRGFLPKVIVGACTAIAFTLGAQAVTTEVETTLGGTFSGTIGTAGADFVQGRFLAAGGEQVTLRVQAAPGSTLVPTVTIRDAGGTPLANGFSRRLGWMGVGNITHVFTVPAAGFYLAEVGGTSGSGGFAATLSGIPVLSNLVTVSGSITDSVTTNPVVGATVTVDGNPYDASDASGNYAGQLDPGTYTFEFAAAGYDMQSQMVTVSAGTPITDLDIALVPTVIATVELDAYVVSGDMTPGGVVSATVDITAPPGTIINTITWSQTAGPTAGIAGGSTANPTVTLPGLGAYKDGLVLHLQEPPVTADQLPPNVPFPPGDFPGGLQDRLQVVGINPFALEEAALVKLEVGVHTDLGLFTDHVEIHAEIPWRVSTGLRNVPIDVPVLLQAKEHTSYAWTVTDAPPGSGVTTLDDAGTRHPYFTPDMPGLYQFTLADVPSGSDTLQVYAGTWRGVIVDQDINGRPVSDTACTFCHDGGFAPDKFTDWAQTGHAEIFTDNLNTSTHYGPNCFSCHTVGFDPDTDNGGVDEASDYGDFIASGLINNPGDNWTEVLDQFPETARLANIQCENCHGPQDSFAHGFGGPLGEPRVDLSSDVCATCHGEPLRHARFQQWQLSGHANYDLAIGRGSSGSCSRCHTGNGFLAWLPVLLDDDPATDPLDDLFYCDGGSGTCVGGANAGNACARSSDCPPEWTTDETHPQTCATCHDPHANGTTTGIGTNATVRISGDTPPLIAGFQVTGVGRGAICMTCHNSRRGLRNDSVWDSLSASDKAGAPHGSAQTDVLAGENAYFVAVGDRGGHSYIDDTCVSCHMESTPPPDVLAYNEGGSNHTFYADRNICSDCHSPNLSPDDVQGSIEHLMDMVEDLLEDGYVELIDQLATGGRTVLLPGDCGSGNTCNGGMNDGNACVDDGDCADAISDVAIISEIQFSESRGGQAITVTFTDSSVSGPHRVPDIDVLDPVLPTVTLAEEAPDALLKAGWNWALIHNDGSRGVHNPFFASGALIAARDSLVAFLPAVSRSPRELDPGRPGTGRTEQPAAGTRRLRR